MHDVLIGRARLFREDGPQRFVPGNHVVHGAAEGNWIERAIEAQGGGDVVSGRRPFQAMEEPEALLPVGKRDAFGPRLAGERLVGSGVLAEARGQGSHGRVFD
jgi:hypothetical protein